VKRGEFKEPVNIFEIRQDKSSALNDKTLGSFSCAYANKSDS